MSVRPAVEGEGGEDEELQRGGHVALHCQAGPLQLQSVLSAAPVCCDATRQSAVTIIAIHSCWFYADIKLSHLTWN